MQKKGLSTYGFYYELKYSTDMLRYASEQAPPLAQRRDTKVVVQKKCKTHIYGQIRATTVRQK